jgi:acyl carrier protein
MNAHTPTPAIKPISLETIMLAALVKRFAFVDASDISFNTDLMRDLGLDSMQLVQLLVDLEVEHGIKIPESALEKKDFSTLTALAEKLQSTNSPEKAAETAPAEMDIKVHCFVSCLCEPIKKIPGIDHRPFYFGVWDAELFVDEQYRLSYHSVDVVHDFFVDWYQRLYGINLLPWYDHRLSKIANIQRLNHLLLARRPDQWVMVMLDLYQLPERENKFNKNPFPHYVMLENMADPELVWMWDPDFRWQGALNRPRVFNAVAQTAVAGGYTFCIGGVKAPDIQMLDEYFVASMVHERNPMTDAVRDIVHAHAAQCNGLAPADLPQALRELPVLAIRKYAYEHGLAFFWRDLALPEQEFEDWCLVVEQLVKAYDRVQFLAIKYAQQLDADVLWEIEQCLRAQDVREFQIKERLCQVHRMWRHKYNLIDLAAPGVEPSPVHSADLETIHD